MITNVYSNCGAKNGSVNDVHSYKVSELIRFKLPGLPASRTAWYSIVAKWRCIPRPGKGPGGMVKTFVPPADVQRLIDLYGAKESVTKSEESSVGVGRPPESREESVTYGVHEGPEQHRLKAPTALLDSIEEQLSFDLTDAELAAITDFCRSWATLVKGDEVGRMRIEAIKQGVNVIRAFRVKGRT